MEDASKLIICALLTLILLISELVIGQFSHCLTLQAVTNQSLYNLLTLTSAIVALKLEGRSPRLDLRSSFGWARLEVVGSLSSLVFLASLSFFTGIECLQTLFHNDHLDAMHQSFSVFSLVVIHFLIWMVVFCLIGGYSFQQSKIMESSTGGIQLTSGQRNANHSTSGKFRGIFHVPSRNIFRDLAGCVILILLSGGVFFFENNLNQKVKYIDPCLSLLSLGALLVSSYPIAKEAGLILLQTIPDKIDVNELRAELFRNFPAILNIHDMHIWCLVPTNIVVTMHVIFQNQESYNNAIVDIKSHLTERGISKFTIQPEMASGTPEDPEVMITEHLCLLDCAPTCRGRIRPKCHKPLVK
ncbi:hypothetical protein TCAL_07445 [Tigriopus californicus]|uniref:Cation efflux protein cytoplasmic domain-containing protein n=1 Tax=Tigriopus californicus TaxID=6832 RepID=A0A553N7C3_TIGCA|nr:calcium/manganese antiporter SLC30A10-like [Tigriopus californicus]XP_059089665.1 calcium/manganese antiporter SLC30A10-like [Tigriopus californicus]TRY61336.1 hypothetical protein TCAL_07445 [Tigriopus californicus]